MLFDFNLAAVLGIGSIAATLFWRLLSRVETKVDYVVQNMISKSECAANRDSFREMFNGHDHTPEGDLVIIRRPHGPVYKGSEDVPGEADKVVSQGPGKVLGETL